MPLMNIPSRPLFELAKSQVEASGLFGHSRISEGALSITMPADHSLAALATELLVPTGWRFLLIDSAQRLIATVPVRLDAGPRGKASAGGIEYSGNNIEVSLSKAFSAAESSIVAAMQFEGELRTIEIPWLGKAYLWVASSDPTFVNLASPQKLLTESEYRAQVVCEWHSNLRSITERTKFPGQNQP